MPASPNTFRWQYNDGSGWSAWSAAENVTGVPQALPAIGGDTGQGLLITLTVDDNATGDYWTFFAESNAPLRLPALGRPPGGYIEWLSNIPNP